MGGVSQKTTWSAEVDCNSRRKESVWTRAERPPLEAEPPLESRGAAYARSLKPVAPAILAQLAQQYTVSPYSTPWPTTRQPQWPHSGARAWMAHSKESNACDSPASVTVKALS